MSHSYRNCIQKKMSKVDVCPKNLTERQNASRRLRCGFDEYGNNQYVCLPNKEKSSFIELCYNGLIGLFEKGIFLLLKFVSYYNL